MRTDKEIIKALYNRLNACHTAMDDATDVISEWFPDNIKESQEAIGLIHELAENETLLIKIESLNLFDEETEEQTPIEKSLNEACDLVTVEMLNNIQNGEEIKLNENFTLYYYLEDEIFVLNHTETWTEILAVMYGEDNKTVEFEQLEDVNNLK